MWKTGFFIGGLIASALIYQVFERVPSDALNVALGVACGIFAGIPVSLGLLIALSRERQRNRQQNGLYDPEPESVRHAPQPPQRTQPPVLADMQSQQPQIIVIAPPQGQFSTGQFPQGFPMPAQWLGQQYPFLQETSKALDARDWRIIGEE